MPKVSIMTQIPSALKEELHQRLLDSGFGNLEGHAAWLRDQGISISRSALQRYSRVAKDSNTVTEHIARTIKPLSGETGVDLVNLFIELGGLRVREAKILALIDDAIAKGAHVPHGSGL